MSGRGGHLSYSHSAPVGSSSSSRRRAAGESDRARGAARLLRRSLTEATVQATRSPAPALNKAPASLTQPDCSVPAACRHAYIERLHFTLH